MEYTSQNELYTSLMPVFNVKQRILSYQNKEISNTDIWTILTNLKWKKSVNLTLSEIVNDIIIYDISKIYGGHYE